MTTDELRQHAHEWGADLVGVADLSLLEGIPTYPPDLLAGYTRAVSIAVRLADGVIDAIVDRPTPLYQQHYQRVNILLDLIALRVSGFLQQKGAKALPIPASQVLDETAWTSYLSHKAVALAAGIGWQGKSLLVVNRDYGPRIRLVTVLTDLELPADRPVKNMCAECSACADACPAQAIRNVNTTWHYANREEALVFQRCADKVSQEFRRIPFIEHPICGVCIRACPFGQKKSSGNHRGQRLTKEPPF